MTGGPHVILREVAESIWRWILRLRFAPRRMTRGSFLVLNFNDF